MSIRKEHTYGMWQKIHKQTERKVIATEGAQRRQWQREFTLELTKTKRKN